MTIADALQRAEQRLREAGTPHPDWDAEVLLRHVLGWDRAAVLVRAAEELPSAEGQRFFLLVEGRASRRPLPHLTGTQAFWRHEFLVTPDVLIPRPETEVLVEVALEKLRDVRRPVVVDVGTGSGCVALSLAAERPDAEVHATDVSEAALNVAEENARRLGLADRVSFHRGSLLTPVARLLGAVDLVASNPPYVDPADVSGLAPEVRDHEPRSALVTSDAPYGIYGQLFRAAQGLLARGGWVAVEVGQGMAERVAGLAADAGLRAEQAVSDLQGIPRVVVARRAV